LQQVIIGGRPEIAEELQKLCHTVITGENHKFIQ